ncbi:MAG: ABC transporter permease [Gemmatimonadota bacterium]
MKWREIVRFELVYQLRRRSTWVFFGVSLLPLMGEMNGEVLEAQSGENLFNAPLSVAQSSVTMTLIALVVIAAVAGDAATRDTQTRTEPLMHAAPVGRGAYLGGRFLGAFLVVALLLTAVPLAFLLTPLLHPGLEPELVAPFQPAVYLQSYFLLIVPNAFVATALLFALATLVRHTMGSYLGAAMVFAGTLLTMGFVGRALGRWDLATLLSPSGHAALAVMDRTWSPVDLNTRLVGLDGGLLWNRLLWLALAFAVLGFTYTRFRYGANGGSARWWHRGRLGSAGADRDDAAAEPAERLDGAVLGRSAPVAVPRVSREFAAAGRMRQTLTVARDSLREMVTGWSWLVVPFLALQIVLNLEDLKFRGMLTLPTTGRVLEVLADPLITVLIFVVLFAGELVWRERDANMHALADAAPVPDWVRFVGKLIGLWLVIVALHGLLMLAGMLTQVLRGWYEFDVPLYVQVLFGIELVEPLVFALLALSVHVLVNQKHLGHLAVLLLVLARNTLAPWLGIEHPLLLFGIDPGWSYSPISGFGPFVGPVLWFEAYWAAWTLVVALLAFLFWVRGVEPGTRERLRNARHRVTGRTVGTVAAALGLALLVGGFLFYNIEILNAYHSTAESARRQAEYERRYGNYEDAPQPQLTTTELQVEIYPDRRAADVRGVYRLENRTPQPIDSIHVAVALEPEVDTSAIEFDRPARAVLVDDELGHRIYALEKPVQPGDSLRMRWQVRYDPRGFPARDISTAVVENGSFIETYEWMPLLGYQSSRELTDAVARREHGLPERPALPSLDDLVARRDPERFEGTDLEVTIGTAADQIAVAPGELTRTWTRDGRRYFHYATGAPIGLEYAIFSADYSVRRARWNDVTIELVHHPAHDLHVERMIRGMEASLEQYTERFGPYPYEVLRMVEYPGEGVGGAHAASSTIWYEAVFSLFDPDHDERGVDLPFAVVAHETAHQFQPAAAVVEGIALLTESFAWYAAMGVIEEEYGVDHLERFLDFMRRDYLDPRSRADVPLLRSADRFLAYRKGPLAMYALREYMGQDRVDLAWRRLIAQHASHEAPFATSLDLYRELQEVTPDSLQYLLLDLLERNTFWELETRQAMALQAPGGEWQVRLDVEARKVAVDTSGAETEIPMDDLTEIGVYAPSESGESPGTPLYLAMHRVRTGPQTITITVPRRPARAGIDPRHLLIDVEMDDNVVDIPNSSSSTD